MGKRRTTTVPRMANQGTTLITHLRSRWADGAVAPLNGPWRAIVDPYQTGYIGITGERNPQGWFRDFKPRHEGDRVEYDFDRSMVLQVPGDWNTQSPDLFWYEGTLWYRKKFTTTDADSGRTFVHFAGSNHTTRVFFDGVELALHEGGFGTFAAEITGRIAPGEHSLIAMVDNRRTTDRIPAMRTDWFNFGGLHRPVSLVRVPDTFIKTAWMTMAPDGSIIGSVECDGSGVTDMEATVAIPELGVRVTVPVNEQFTIAEEVADLERWHPGRPTLYDVHFSIPGDEVVEQIGFRTLEVRGTDIIVNGERVFLKGISMHAEGPSGGSRATGPDDAATLLQWAQDLGANFVRLGHYQHDEAMVAEADRRGLLVWSELPVYWGIDWLNAATLENAIEQADELVLRDRNRASVALWSVANETLPGAARTAFLGALIARVRLLDPTRLVTAALFTLPGEGMETHIEDPLGELVDVIGVNQYYGWYYGDRADLPNKRWTTDFNKPIIFSELGAGAKYGNHGEPTEIWTEEFQAAVYEAQIAMISAQPDCAGLSPWILKDFRTPLRVLPGIQDGYNRKGLVSEEGERKLAFDVLANWYRSLD